MNYVFVEWRGGEKSVRDPNVPRCPSSAGAHAIPWSTMVLPLVVRRVFSAPSPGEGGDARTRLVGGGQEETGKYLGRQAMMLLLAGRRTGTSCGGCFCDEDKKEKGIVATGCCSSLGDSSVRDAENEVYRRESSTRPCDESKERWQRPGDLVVHCKRCIVVVVGRRRRNTSVASRRFRERERKRK